MMTIAPAEVVVNTETLLGFFGRVHPTLVHFPIALLVAAALFETLHAVVRRFRSDASTCFISPTGRACLALGVAAAAAAAWSGWTREDLTPITGSVATLVPIHRWLGISAAALGAIALVLSVPAGKRHRFACAYRVVLILAAVVVGVTGHYGGSITWGPGYLTEGFFPVVAADPPEANPEFDPVLATVDFVRDIEPILSGYCYDCHGPRRQKGKLRLDRRSVVLAREDIVPGDPDSSELIRRVMLDPGDDDFMPQDDDPLGPERVALLRAWIAEGASWGNAPEPVEADSAEPVVSAPPPAPTQTALTPDERAALVSLGALGATIEPITIDAPGLDAHLELCRRFTDDHAADLLRLGDRLVWLDLAGTGITDATVIGLGDLAGLERLHLENTAVTDAGVAALSGLPKLRYLNLHSTAVTDAALASIATMPALGQVYLFGTGVTAEGVEFLRAARPELKIGFTPD